MHKSLSPPIVSRPLLAVWMFLRGLKPKDGADPLEVGAEQVRRYCLPFADPLRVVPPTPVMERILRWTGQEVRPEHFYPRPGGGEHPIPESWVEEAINGTSSALATADEARL